MVKTKAFSIVNGFIYKLSSKNTDNVYIGSTTEPLSIRLSKHKFLYKKFLLGKFHYITAFELLKHDDVIIEMISCHKDIIKAELLKHEKDAIKADPKSINKNCNKKKENNEIVNCQERDANFKNENKNNIIELYKKQIETIKKKIFKINPNYKF
jgi:hypothetical protein